MAKIAYIGAGSAGFGKQLVAGILSRPELASVSWSRRDWKLLPPPDANTATEMLISRSSGPPGPVAPPLSDRLIIPPPSRVFRPALPRNGPPGRGWFFVPSLLWFPARGQ